MYSIQDYENTIRTLVLLLIGSDESSYKVSHERIEKWKEKRSEENKKYAGLNPELRLIYYSDFYDLKTIIGKNWEVFKPILDEKKRFEIYFDEISALRNSYAHGRDLFPHQLQFINYIVEDIKSKIVVHHNKSMSTNDYFIKVLKVSDNYGGNWSTTTEMLSVRSETILRVGDQLTLLVDAYDPKGRTITYKLRAIKDKSSSITSTQNCLTISVTKEMVAKNSLVQLIVSTEEEAYENRATFSILYTILP